MTPQDRCRSRKCAAKRDSIEAERCALEIKLRQLESRFDLIVEGEVRRHCAPLEDEIRRLSGEQAGREAALRDVRVFKMKAFELGRERGVLLLELSEVRAELVRASATISSMTRRDVIDSRARVRDANKLLAIIKSERDDAIASCNSIVVDAEHRILDAENRASDAAANALLTLRDCEAARAEADDEAAAARQAEASQGLAEYQSFLAARQVERAKATALRGAERVKRRVLYAL